MSGPANANPSQSVATPAQLVPLPAAQRWLTGILGLGAFLAGAVAVFRAGDGTGALALLLSGLVLIVLTLAGALPTRLKFGQGELEWQARAKVAENVLAEVAEADPNMPGSAADAIRQARDTLARLRSGEFIGADLRYVDLSGADLSASRLTGTRLTNAELSSVDFRGARFTRADFDGALFEDVHWGQATFRGERPPADS